MSNLRVTKNDDFDNSSKRENINRLLNGEERILLGLYEMLPYEDKLKIMGLSAKMASQVKAKKKSAILNGIKIVFTNNFVPLSKSQGEKRP